MYSITIFSCTLKVVSMFYAQIYSTSTFIFFSTSSAKLTKEPSYSVYNLPLKLYWFQAYIQVTITNMTLHWNDWMYECMFEWYFTIACKAELIICCLSSSCKYIICHVCMRDGSDKCNKYHKTIYKREILDDG